MTQIPREQIEAGAAAIEGKWSGPQFLSSFEIARLVLEAAARVAKP